MPFRKSKPWGLVKPDAGFAQDFSHPFANGLLARWIFNEGAGAQSRSIVGANLTATHTSSPTWAPGKFGKTVKFAGSAYLNVPSAMATNGSNTTVCFWIKLDSYSSFGAIPFSFNDGVAHYWQIVASGGALTGFIVQASSTLAASGIDFTDGTWRHVAMVANGSNAEVLINGVSIVSGSVSPIAVSALAVKHIAIGDYVDGLASNWHTQGALEDLRFYNRALSATLIRAIYMRPFEDIITPRRRIIREISAAAAGTTIVQLERKIRGLNRGLVRGMS